MKTNKSYSKRLKVTKNRKLLARKAGGNHYNARERREKQLKRRRLKLYCLPNKLRGRFLPGVGAKRVKENSNSKES